MAHKLNRMTVVAFVVCGIALLGSATMAAADKSVAKPPAGDAFAARSIVNRILDRWYPVASELKQDVAVWRAQFKAVLERSSLQTLQSIDAIEAKSAGPNRTLMQLYQTAFSMAVADVGAQLAKQMQGASTAKLGSPTTDLVFVGFTPCRVVDTRNSGLGISAGTQRNFYYFSDGTPASWSTQGGDAGAASTACPNTVFTSAGGTLGNVAPAAAMANITAVNTTAAGNFIAWGGGAGSIPNTSVLNWDHAGEIIANTTVIPWGGRTGGNLDFTVRYNGPSGFSDVVVDIMGYFIENAATALDCTTATASGPINIGTGSDTTINYPACPGGYTRTGGYCDGGASTGTSGIYIVETGAVACVFRNLGGATATGNAISQCCRVPGR